MQSIDGEKLYQVGKEIQDTDNQNTIKLKQPVSEIDDEKLHQLGGEFLLFTGVTYNNIRIKDALPSQEQLKERMELLQKELRETKRLMNKQD